MSLVIHPLNLTNSQLGITLRSRQSLVPQHLLDGAQIGPFLQHMRSKRVTERMRRQRRMHADIVSKRTKDASLSPLSSRAVSTVPSAQKELSSTCNVSPNRS